MAIKAANQMTIVDITDAYSVMLTSEAYTFVGSTSGVGSGQACTTDAVAFCGANQCSSVNVDASAIVCPTGISATVANSGTAKVTITFKTTATISAACEATIPVVVDGITVNKKFSFAVAKAGSAGKGISSITEQYYLSTSATSLSGGSWSTTRPTATAGKYIWTRSVITYTDGSSKTTEGISVTGDKGATGAKGDTGAQGPKGDTGATGAAGRTYLIEPSCSILKRSADNNLLPASIEFKAYYRDGTSATRSAYAGRFVIEKSTDGSTWTTAYTGTANASAVTFTTSSLGTDIMHIRCKLYAAGGTTTLLDMQSVPIVKDISALTHEEIFNLLTNDGAVKSIYEENGQLYISFTYAKGGTLALGGSGNGNGTLKILDASGKQVGYIDNTGVNFTKGTFTGAVNAASGTIANWVLSSTGLRSKNYNSSSGDGILLSGGDPDNDVLPRIKLGEILMIPQDGLLKIKYGLQVHVKGSDEEGFSDGSGRMKIIGLESTTSGTTLALNSNAVYKLSSSSLRYKSLGKKLTEEDVEDLYNISTVWAKYKDGYLSSDDRRCGQYMPMFVAENIEQYFPIAVEYEDGKVEDWNQKIMTPTMFAMLKFQKQKIDALENEVAEIKRTLASVTTA